MRYSDIIPIAASNLPAATVYSFRANSIYDPDLTGVGHQPRYHDQWSNFYERYMVVGSNITVKFLKDGDAGVYTYESLYIELNDQGSSTVAYATNPYTAFETNLTKKRIMTNREDRPLALKHFYKSKPFFNLTNLKDHWDHLGGQMGNFGTGSNPDKGAYFHVGTREMTGGTTIAKIISVVIDYVVLFRDPVKPSTS